MRFLRWGCDVHATVAGAGESHGMKCELTEGYLGNVAPVQCNIKPTFCRIRVSDANLWLAEMSELSSEEKSHLVFRGQGDSKWPITSSFERAVFPESKAVSTNLRFKRFAISPFDDVIATFEQKLVAEESTILETFIRKIKAIAPQDVRPKTQLDWLALMQHHGIPTRLIDFTRSPQTALFFAMHENLDADYSVWAVNSEKCARVTSHSVESLADHRYTSKSNLEIAEDILVRQNETLGATWRKFSSMLRIEPQSPNPRMVAQEGLFMMPTSLAFPVEATFYNDVAEVSLAQMLTDRNGEYVSKPIAWEVVEERNARLDDFRAIQFIFDKTSRGAVQDLLAHNGIDADKLFPKAPIDREVQSIKAELENRLYKSRIAEELADVVWWI